MGNESEYKMNMVETIVCRDLGKEMIEFQEKLSEYDLKMDMYSKYYSASERLYYGYKKKFGYYMLYKERSEITCLFKTDNKEIFLAEWLISALHSYAFDFELDNRNTFVKDWHYYEKDVFFDEDNKELKFNNKDELNRIKEKIKDIKTITTENDTWKYDLKYDGRKYAFEYIIHTLQKANINKIVYSYVIEECVKYMNITNEIWKFDDQKIEFIML